MADTLVFSCDHAPVFEHVFGRSVVVVPVTLSFRMAVAQSYCTASGHTTLYQNERLVAEDGRVKVWTIDESPLVAAVDPSWAEYAPLCGLVTAAAVPTFDHDVSVPVSKPP